jgi:hypothetical protein
MDRVAVSMITRSWPWLERSLPLPPLLLQGKPTVRNASMILKQSKTYPACIYICNGVINVTGGA